MEGLGRWGWALIRTNSYHTTLWWVTPHSVEKCSLAHSPRRFPFEITLLLLGNGFNRCEVTNLDRAILYIYVGSMARHISISFSIKQIKKTEPFLCFLQSLPLHILPCPKQAAKAQEQQVEGLRARLDASKTETQVAAEQLAASQAHAQAAVAEQASLEGKLEAVMEGARQVGGPGFGCELARQLT